MVEKVSRMCPSFFFSFFSTCEELAKNGECCDIEFLSDKLYFGARRAGETLVFVCEPVQMLCCNYLFRMLLMVSFMSLF